MKVTSNKSGTRSQYIFMDLKSYPYGSTVYTETDHTNCKLSYIHGTGILEQYDDKDKKEIIDFLLKNLKGCIILNTIIKDVADFIEKTYPTYYYHDVPIGYCNGYQYHICFKNVINVNESCRTPKKSASVKAHVEVIVKRKAKKIVPMAKKIIKKVLKKKLYRPINGGRK